MIHPKLAFLAWLATCAVAAVACTDSVEPESSTESTAIETSKSELTIDPLAFGKSLVGKPYGWWLGGPLPAAAPMWTANGAPPSASSITSTNCTGLTNLILRSVGKPPPSDPSGQFAKGGTAAYYAKYLPVSKPIDPAARYAPGTLLVRNYRDVRDQGHVAVVIGGDLVLQSYAHKYLDTAPGVDDRMAFTEAQRRFHFEIAVPPERWLGTIPLSDDCRWGDGLYCGGDGVAGDPATLYRCVGGAPRVEKSCAKGCISRPPEQDDACAR